MNSIYVLHVGDEPVCERVDVRWHEIKPNEPYEIPEYDAQVIMERVPHASLVIVPEVRQGYNRTLDVNAAREQAKDLLYEQEQRLIAEYIEAQRTDRLARNAAAVPPAGITAKAIDKHKIDLTQYGINPVGYKAKEKRQAEIHEMETLRKQNQELAGQVANLTDQVQQLLEAFTKSQQANEPAKPTQRR